VIEVVAMHRGGRWPGDELLGSSVPMLLLCTLTIADIDMQSIPKNQPNQLGQTCREPVLQVRMYASERARNERAKASSPVAVGNKATMQHNNKTGMGNGHFCG
jgi:hypothetical protein